MTAATAPIWHFDRTGFPYLVLPGGRLAVGLLPVTRAQAELHLADPAGPGDDWYAEVLAVAPRAGWRVADDAPPWRLLLTGVTADELTRLAGWVGPRYRLPDAAEWRAADRALGAVTGEQFRQLLAAIDGGTGHPAAAGILRRLSRAGRRTAGQLALTHDGALEWVTRRGGPPGGLGRPPAELVGRPLILDPQAFDPVTPTRPGRHPAYGGRLVVPLTPGAAR